MKLCLPWYATASCWRPVPDFLPAISNARKEPESPHHPLENAWSPVRGDWPLAWLQESCMVEEVDVVPCRWTTASLITVFLSDYT